MHSTSSSEKTPSGVTSLWPMPSLRFAVVEDLVAAAQHAGDVGADLHVVLACRLGAEHGVVRKHVAYVQLEDADALRDLGDDGVGDVADLVLRVEQHGDERGALERVDGDELVEAGGQLRRKDCVCYCAHRKISAAGEADSSATLRNDNKITHSASSPAPDVRRQGPSLRRSVQFNSSVFLEAEVGLIAITILNRLVREAKPAAGDTKSNARLLLLRLLRDACC